MNRRTTSVNYGTHTILSPRVKQYVVKTAWTQVLVFYIELYTATYLAAAAVYFGPKRNK